MAIGLLCTYRRGSQDDSGRDADHVTVRKTGRHSLGRICQFWKRHGVWPESTPYENDLQLEYEGPSPDDLDSAACAECGSNVWIDTSYCEVG